MRGGRLRFFLFANHRFTIIGHLWFTAGGNHRFTIATRAGYLRFTGGHVVLKAGNLLFL